ncbi:hypothetical protein EDD30_6977 [Couchioplanes caeruleus]|uniref:Secreted protein n=1 Tax=Couchioplanes caeruleus TaxID=56438 RepID=A0A3N1GUL4_9ACTN|nr:hypothetical protein EDD30_6977 [Couchioplanes caeruleus]
MAAGGGCRAWAYQNPSVVLHPCISMGGTTAYADVYVDAMRSDCIGTRLQVWERNGSWNQARVDYSRDCSLGHKGPVTYQMTGGRYYWTQVCVQLHTGNSNCSTSPEVWR